MQQSNPVRKRVRVGAGRVRVGGRVAVVRWVRVGRWRIRVTSAAGAVVGIQLRQRAARALRGRQVVSAVTTMTERKSIVTRTITTISISISVAVIVASNIVLTKVVFALQRAHVPTT